MGIKSALKAAIKELPHENRHERERRKQMADQAKRQHERVIAAYHARTRVLDYEPQSISDNTETPQSPGRGMSRASTDFLEGLSVPSKIDQVLPQRQKQRMVEDETEPLEAMTDKQYAAGISNPTLRGPDHSGTTQYRTTSSTRNDQNQRSQNEVGRGAEQRLNSHREYSGSRPRLPVLEPPNLKSEPGQQVENRDDRGTHLQLRSNDRLNIPKISSLTSEMASALHDWENPEAYYTTSKHQFLSNNTTPTSPEKDKDIISETSKDERLVGSHCEKISRLSINGKDGVPHHKITQPSLTNEAQHRQTTAKTLHELHNEDVGKFRENRENALQKQQEIHEARVNEIETRWQADLDTISREKHNLTTELCKVREEKETLSQLIRNHESSIENLRLELESTKEDRNSFRLQLSHNARDLETTQETLAKSQNEVSVVSKKLNTMRREADALEKSNTDYTQKVSKLERQLNEREQELVDLRKIREDDRSRHARGVFVLQRQIKDTENDANKQLDLLMTNQRQAIEELESIKETEILQLVSKHNAEVKLFRQELETQKSEAEEKRRTLKVTHGQQIAQLRQEHERLMAQMEEGLDQVTRDEGKRREDLTAFYDQRIASSIQEHEQALLHVEEELAQVRRNEELKLSRLSEAHMAELAQMALEYKQQTLQMREDVQGLHAALLKRDDGIYQGAIFATMDLPNRPDEQIRTKFSEIAELVEKLGRLQWKQKPDVWTPEVLRDVVATDSERVLKKAIVQDLVWGLLFRHIFCSPFRVFGAEGMLLEKEWNKQCGPGTDTTHEIFSWPEPGAKTERWRYMTVKECRNVLYPPVPSEWDPRMRLRIGFTDNLSELVSELKASLEGLIDLTPGEMQMIKSLPKKAAILWLDFAMHRCRIVIRLQGPAALSAEEKVAAAQQSSLKLTIVPVVGRYGNATGADLDIYKTIDRCTGESMDIPSDISSQ